ncbi:four-carbon acid sugar kinase family protein [Ramlibacter sp. MMS24-I3-19]|uniref:four-carbon acid sugar kinase family protein n=1 Tax=Ramlibacter sp. MMS24-I3-19 TaxID=3416606 RepID=UPI003CFE237B
MDILIIADDLSGAADCAIPFARAAHRTAVALHPLHPDLDADGLTLSIDADTRRLDGDEAAARTRAIYTARRRAGQRLYKKIDSTLRGHWAAEVAALRPLAGTAIVAPAYPALGRTVSGGCVYVGGRALADTELWKLEHEHRPAAIGAQLLEAGLTAESLDADLLHDDPEALSARIEAAASRGVDAVVVDTRTEHALRALALATASSRGGFFWVGSGGLAREIAALLPSRPAHEEPGLQPSTGPTLVLVGSLSAVTDRQCAVLQESGRVRQLVVPPSVLRQGPLHAEWQSLHACIGELLATGTDLLLRIGREQGLDPSEGALLAAALARLVGPHFARTAALIATGGETARAMLVEAGIDSLDLVAELQAGVAAGRPRHGRAHRPFIVTKAGGFGDEHALYAAWSRLRPAP